MQLLKSPALRLLTVTLAVAVALLSSIGFGQEQRELVLVVPSEPGSLDAHRIFTNDDWNVAYHIYDPLMRRNADGDFLPGLVEDWNAVDDESKVWRLSLRRGVEFHNGEPWNADALIYNFERILEDPEATVRQYVGGIDSFRAVDEYTVEISLNTPMALVQQSLYMLGMVPPVHAESGKLASEPIGTGPYEFVKLQRGEYLQLSINADYWGEKPEFETARIRFISDPSARVAALVSGEADVVKGLSVYDVDTVSAGGNAEVVKRDGPRMWHIKLDAQRTENSPGIEGTETNPFVDERVRRAVSLAINRAELVEFGLQGYAQPANQLSAPFVRGHNPDLPALQYDPDEARRLLEEAGFGEGFTVRFDLESGWEIIGELVGSYLKEIGIETQVNVLPSSVYRTTGTQYKTSMILGSWGATMVNTAFDALVHTVEAEGGLGRANFGRYSNPEIDGLIDEARTTFDPDTQTERYQDLQAMALDEMALVPLFHEGLLVGAASDLEVKPWFNEHVMLNEITAK